MRLGERLRSLREERDLTQQQLADAVGKSRAAIGKYETGERMPDNVTLHLICDYFDVTFDYMTGRSDCRGVQPASLEECLAEDTAVTYRGVTLTNREKKAILSIIDTVMQVSEGDA